MKETPARPQEDVGLDVGEHVGRRRRTRRYLANLIVMARTVADADAARIEQTARQFGESRRYFAPIADSFRFD